MKGLTCAAFAVALGMSGAAIAQGQPTADELIAKNLAARGGAEKLAALQSVQLNGKMRFPGDFELTYKETRARGAKDDSVRIEAALQGLALIQAYDGANAWRINPFQGRRDAERMSADEARSLADSGSMTSPLLAAKSDGSTVEYLGREDFDGTDAYKVKVTQTDGDQFVYLLDPDTMLEIKVTETRTLRGSPQITEIEMGDYEQVGGVYFPMSVEIWQQGSPNQRQRINIASAEANPPVTPALFAEPGAPAAPTAAPASSN